MGFTNLNPNKNKYFAVPEELKGYKNWVCWQSYPDPKSHSGISKKPINQRLIRTRKRSTPVGPETM